MNIIANVIGNISPYHKGHEHLTNFALSRADQVIFHIGSANLWPHRRTIFTPQERETMIHLSHEISVKRGKITTSPTPDFSEDQDWIAFIKNASKNQDSQESQNILVGYEKDDSSYYLKSFKDWIYIPAPQYRNLSATPIREKLLKEGKNWLATQDAQNALNHNVIEWLGDTWFESDNHKKIVELFASKN